MKCSLTALILMAACNQCAADGIVWGGGFSVPTPTGPVKAYEYANEDFAAAGMQRLDSKYYEALQRTPIPGYGVPAQTYDPGMPVQTTVPVTAPQQPVVIQQTIQQQSAPAYPAYPAYPWRWNGYRPYGYYNPYGYPYWP